MAYSGFVDALGLLRQSARLLWAHKLSALFLLLLMILCMAVATSVLLIDLILTGAPVVPFMATTLFWVLRIILLVCVWFAIFGFVAVAWHRRVFLDDEKLRNALPAAPRYAFRLFAISVLAFLAVVIPGMVAIMLIGGGRINIGDFILAYFQSWAHVVVTALLTWGFFWLFWKFCHWPVEAALGDKVREEAPFPVLQQRKPTIKWAAAIATALFAVWGAVYVGLSYTLGYTTAEVVKVGIGLVAFMWSLAIQSELYRMKTISSVVEGNGTDDGH